MSLRKRGHRSGGSTSSRQAVSEYADLLRPAIVEQGEELHDKLKSEVWRLQRLGDRPRRIWQDAAVRWLREQAHKASLEEDKEKLRWLDRYLADRDLESINRAIDRWHHRSEAGDGCSNATVNRTLASDSGDPARVRSRLGMVGSCAGGETPQGAATTHSILEPAPGADAVARAARCICATWRLSRLATGLRAANVTGLTWEQVDLSRKLAWIHPDQAKARRAIAVPLNDAAMQVVQEQGGKHPVQRVHLRGATDQAGQHQRLGTRRSSAPVSRTSAGTTCATRGPPGTCRAERRSSRYRNSPVGRPRRWCDVMRTWPRIIWRSMPATRKVTAQIRHNRRMPRHSPIDKLVEKLRNLMVARGGIEPPTRGFSVRCSTN